MFGYDIEFMQDMVNQFKETLLQIAVVPMKVTYTDFTGCVYDKFEQRFVSGTPEEIEINIRVAIKKGKGVGEDTKNPLLASIPLGKYGVFIPYEDRLNLKDLNNESRNTLKFELYPNSEIPIKLNPDEDVPLIQYFLNHEDFPVYQLFICGVER